MSVWAESVWSSGSESCMPRTIASRPSDSGRAYFSSIRSASWTISAISRSTGSSRAYSPRKVSKEQSSPRWESLAPTTSKSSAPSGATAGSPKKEKVASGSTKRLISQMQAVRSTWHPRRVAHSIRPRPPRSERLRSALRGPLRPGGRPCAPQPLRLGDDGSIGLLPRGAEGFHQLGFLGHGPWSSLPEGRLSPGLPHPELQPLQLLAGDGVLGERRNPVLEVEGAEVPQLAPHRHAVTRGLPREAVDQQHPARSLHSFSLRSQQGPHHPQHRAGGHHQVDGHLVPLQHQERDDRDHKGEDVEASQGDSIGEQDLRGEVDGQVGDHTHHGRRNPYEDRL